VRLGWIPDGDPHERWAHVVGQWQRASVVLQWIDEIRHVRYGRGNPPSTSAITRERREGVR